MGYYKVNKAIVKRNGEFSFLLADGNVRPLTYYTTKLKYKKIDVLDDNEIALEFLLLISSQEYHFTYTNSDFLHYVFIEIENKMKDLSIRYTDLLDYKHSRLEELEECVNQLITFLRRLLITEEQITKTKLQKGYLQYKKEGKLMELYLMQISKDRDDMITDLKLCSIPEYALECTII